MTQLQQVVHSIDVVIAQKGLDRFRTRGVIGLEAGMTIGLITEATPDDDDKLARLRKATREVLGVQI